MLLPLTPNELISGLKSLPRTAAGAERLVGAIVARSHVPSPLTPAAPTGGANGTQIARAFSRGVRRRYQPRLLPTPDALADAALYSWRGVLLRYLRYRSGLSRRPALRAAQSAPSNSRQSLRDPATIAPRAEDDTPRRVSLTSVADTSPAFHRVTTLGKRRVRETPRRLSALLARRITQNALRLVARYDPAALSTSTTVPFSGWRPPTQETGLIPVAALRMRAETPLPPLTQAVSMPAMPFVSWLGRATPEPLPPDFARAAGEAGRTPPAALFAEISATRRQAVAPAARRGDRKIASLLAAHAAFLSAASSIRSRSPAYGSARRAVDAALRGTSIVTSAAASGRGVSMALLALRAAAALPPLISSDAGPDTPAKDRSEDGERAVSPPDEEEKDSANLLASEEATSGTHAVRPHWAPPGWRPLTQENGFKDNDSESAASALGLFAPGLPATDSAVAARFGGRSRSRRLLGRLLRRSNLAPNLLESLLYARAYRTPAITLVVSRPAETLLALYRRTQTTDFSRFDATNTAQSAERQDAQRRLQRQSARASLSPAFPAEANGGSRRTDGSRRANDDRRFFALPPLASASGISSGRTDSPGIRSVGTVSAPGDRDRAYLRQTPWNLVRLLSRYGAASAAGDASFLFVSVPRPAFAAPSSLPNLAQLYAARAALQSEWAAYNNTLVLQRRSTAAAASLRSRQRRQIEAAQGGPGRQNVFLTASDAARDAATQPAAAKATERRDDGRYDEAAVERLYQRLSAALRRAIALRQLQEPHFSAQIATRLASSPWERWAGGQLPLFLWERTARDRAALRSERPAPAARRGMILPLLPVVDAAQDGDAPAYQPLQRGNGARRVPTFWREIADLPVALSRRFAFLRRDLHFAERGSFLGGEIPFSPARDGGEKRPVRLRFAALFTTQRAAFYRFMRGAVSQEEFSAKSANRPARRAEFDAANFLAEGLSPLSGAVGRAIFPASLGGMQNSTRSGFRFSALGDATPGAPNAAVLRTSLRWLPLTAKKRASFKALVSVRGPSFQRGIFDAVSNRRQGASRGRAIFSVQRRDERMREAQTQGAQGREGRRQGRYAATFPPPRGFVGDRFAVGAAGRSGDTAALSHFSVAAGEVIPGNFSRWVASPGKRFFAARSQLFPQSLSQAYTLVPSLTASLPFSAPSIARALRARSDILNAATRLSALRPDGATRDALRQIAAADSSSLLTLITSGRAASMLAGRGALLRSLPFAANRAAPIVLDASVLTDADALTQRIQGREALSPNRGRGRAIAYGVSSPHFGERVDIRDADFSANKEASPEFRPGFTLSPAALSVLGSNAYAPELAVFSVNWRRNATAEAQRFGGTPWSPRESGFLEAKANRRRRFLAHPVASATTLSMPPTFWASRSARRGGAAQGNNLAGRYAPGRFGSVRRDGQGIGRRQSPEIREWTVAGGSAGGRGVPGDRAGRPAGVLTFGNLSAIFAGDGGGRDALILPAVSTFGAGAVAAGRRPASGAGADSGFVSAAEALADPSLMEPRFKEQATSARRISLADDPAMAGWIQRGRSVGESASETVSSAFLPVSGFGAGAGDALSGYALYRPATAGQTPPEPAVNVQKAADQVWRLLRRRLFAEAARRGGK